jgi:hypothetical protein
MFRYRLHSPDGDDLGEACLRGPDQTGEEVHLDAGQRFRVLDRRAVRRGGRVAGRRLLKVEAA